MTRCLTGLMRAGIAREVPYREILFTEPCTLLYGPRANKAALSGIRPLAAGGFLTDRMRYGSRSVKP